MWLTHKYKINIPLKDLSERKLSSIKLTHAFVSIYTSFVGIQQTEGMVSKASFVWQTEALLRNPDLRYKPRLVLSNDNQTSPNTS